MTAGLRSRVGRALQYAGPEVLKARGLYVSVGRAVDGHLLMMIGTGYNFIMFTIVITSGGGGVDMRAVYLQSVRSPHQRGALLRDIARYRQRRHMSEWRDVDSHPIDSDEGSDDEDYVEDSFCVNGNVSETQGELISHRFTQQIIMTYFIIIVL